MLTILQDRIIVQHTPSVQEKVAALLSDSGVATPARRGESHRGQRVSGDAGGREGGTEDGRGSGQFAPVVHEPRVSE